MILVTGGLGYIGSHTVIELIKLNKEIVIVDDLSNSKEIVLDRLETITGKRVLFYKVDCADKEEMEKIFSAHAFESVIHFAGFKAVGESVEHPLKYYQNNLISSLVLLDLMNKYQVKQIVFSSSATVYGDPESVPIVETSRLSCTNPYGRTKWMIEEILRDVAVSDASMSIALLRYFNPIGAHESGLIGEDPNGVPNNLMPYITQVAAGKRASLGVFGNDYATHDGTGVRDYIHVVDLALGHVKALEYLAKHKGVEAFNLGTGIGYSVLDVVHAFEKASGISIPYEIKDRRSGDIAACYADPSYAKVKLDWRAKYDINKMCEDSWNWQSTNPNGFNV
jgi:UDP-glucose 4-epimerase